MDDPPFGRPCEAGEPGRAPQREPPVSAQCEVTARRAARQPMGIFERYLSLWVMLCIVAGIGLGSLVPGMFQTIGRLEIAQVNLPVAVLIWLMVIPMLLKIDFSALHEVGRHWRGIGVTLLVNWAVKLFSMALLGWLFIRVLFADWLPAGRTATSPAWCCWPRLSAPPWSSSGATCATATPTSP